jgi:hypothetical protein
VDKLWITACFGKPMANQCQTYNVKKCQTHEKEKIYKK